VLELLHRYFGIEAANDPVVRREKVQAALTALGIGLTDVRPYLFALFSITDEPDPLAQMNSQVKRRRTLEAIRSVILRESLKQPLVIVFEDLHWVDSETQALLDLLVDSINGARILLLVNYRPEYHHQWSSKSHYTQIRLDPLGGEGAAAMLTALLGDGAELGTIKRLIAERTGGNPFFIEEMVQALFDEGALLRNGAVKVVRPLSQLRMPPTVQGILASRIDHLAAEQKDLLQTLAVIGRESPLGLIRKVVAKPEVQLDPMLADLRAAEFVYEQPALTEPEYVFKHALTQEVAYQSILAERRKKIHERVGAAIEELYRDQLEEHLAKLAHHYQRSPDKEKAVTYLKRAADQAAQRCSIVEAEAQYRDAISILKKLLPAPKRDRIELGVQLGLTAVLIGKSFGASEREKPLVRAAELSDRVGDQGELLGLLFQLGQFYIERLRLNETRKLAERAIALAQGIPDQIQEGGAWYNLAESLFWSGDLLTAKARSEKAWEMLEGVPPELLVSLFGFDLWLLNAWLLGAVELLLGRSDRSLDWENRLLERAGPSSHVYSKAIGIFVASWTASLRREFGKASVLARTARTLSEENGFSEVLSWAMGVEGYARFWQGERKIGITQQKRAIEGLEGVGSLNQASWRMASLAEAQVHLDKLKAAESSLERAFAIVTAGDGWAEPEVHRIAAEVILHKPGGEVLAAQRRFEEAVALARKQSSKWWELRATVGLSRLLASQGRRDEARTMLTEIYGWFTEGFDTADLKDAKALLDELSR
jgi:tetratricopeptide (TPR) repeat protein